MIIAWTRHINARFLERVLGKGIDEGEIELAVVEQKVAFRQPGRETIKTVFPAGKIMITVVKKEKPGHITIVSIWESDENEEKIWIQRQ
jgi:hypothetical protein